MLENLIQPVISLINNIQQFRVDLKNEITKFDDKIKRMMNELNNDILNAYNEDPFNTIDFLEENSLKIKKFNDKRKISTTIRRFRIR